MLPHMSGSQGTKSPVVGYPEKDYLSVPLDLKRHWPSTVESTRNVPHWQVVEEDEEAQAALREVGLA